MKTCQKRREHYELLCCCIFLRRHLIKATENTRSKIAISLKIKRVKKVASSNSVAKIQAPMIIPIMPTTQFQNTSITPQLTFFKRKAFFIHMFIIAQKTRGKYPK